MSDPFGVLGLRAGASADQVRTARRDLAKLHHPDTGGDTEMMRSINAAAGAALHVIATRELAQRDTEPATEPVTVPMTVPVTVPGGVSRDVASFTVEALPVETFEALLVVTGWFGEVVDDEPPYRLDTYLAEPERCWCRLELVPDAGASTVSIAIAADPERPLPDIDAVRDLWVEQLNRYDWS